MPPAELDPTRLCQRLNRGVRRAGARYESGERVRFGNSSRLTLGRYRLGNGLKVLTLVDRSAPVISYHTWYHVGSRNERPGKTGLAHLFEHLMFNETRNLPAGEYDRRIEAAGGETNASTWTDWTHYHADLPASELPLIVELESDRMANLVLREPQLRSEKEVVANERRYRVDDDVEGTVGEKLYALAYKRHPYGWPTIGWMRDIEGFTTADCREFYKTYYAPNNATLVVAGDFDEAQALRLIQKAYGNQRAAKLPRPRRVRETAQRRPRYLAMKRPTPSAKLCVGYRAPAFPDADYAVLSLLNEVLLGGRGSRLFRRLVQRDGLAAEVNSSLAPFVEPGLYDIWLSLRPGRGIEAAAVALDEELARLCAKQVTPKELERVKNRVELGFLSSLETAGGKAEQVGFFEVVCGDAAALFERMQIYRAVTAADLQRVAKLVFDPAQRTRIDVLPAPGAAA
jgi:zinc protease